MSALQIYMAPLRFLPLPFSSLLFSSLLFPQPHPYYFVIAALMGILAIILRNRCVLNKVVCEIDESVNNLYIEKSKMEKLMNEQSYTLKIILDALEARVFSAETALEARVFAAETALEKLRSLTAEQVKEIAFASETASTTYVQSHKPHITCIDQQALNCLKKSPATALQIHRHVTENKSLIHQNFFNNSRGELTYHAVNSCLYNLLHQGRVKKNEASPPVWSTS